VRGSFATAGVATNPRDGHVPTGSEKPTSFFQTTAPVFSSRTVRTPLKLATKTRPSNTTGVAYSSASGWPGLVGAGAVHRQILWRERELAGVMAAARRFAELCRGPYRYIGQFSRSLAASRPEGPSAAVARNAARATATASLVRVLTTFLLAGATCFRLPPYGVVRRISGVRRRNRCRTLPGVYEEHRRPPFAGAAQHESHFVQRWTPAWSLSGGRRRNASPDTMIRVGVQGSLPCGTGVFIPMSRSSPR
jgi:hypothetical protein